MPAIMIPENANKKDFSAPGEWEAYEALSHLIDSDFFCRFNLVAQYYTPSISTNHEIDIIVYHRKMGFLVIEVKVGKDIHVEGDQWFYNDNKMMKEKSPYIQADLNKKTIISEFQQCGLADVLGSKKRPNGLHFWHAVWFPMMTKSEFLSKKKTGRIIDGDETITLFNDDLRIENLTASINRIFNTNPIENSPQHPNTLNLSDTENLKIANFLRPSISFTTKSLNMHILNILLEEQKGFLKYVSQKITYVNGFAGTGKTLIAIEKAKLLSETLPEKGRVLYLCFNKPLMEFLDKNNNYRDKIDYYTIDGFCTRLTGKEKNIYASEIEFWNEGKRVISKTFDDNDKFPWKHIIIDEGQDFGGVIDQSGIIIELKDDIRLLNGQFHVMFDAYQLIQNNLNTSELPKFINDFIKENGPTVTLTKNCRNTRCIAGTSVSVIDNQTDIQLKDDEFIGKRTTITFNDDNLSSCISLDAYLESLENEGLEKNQTVILTMKSEENSFLFAKTVSPKKNSLFRRYKGYEFTSCRRFKGLEADNVILIDFTTQELSNGDLSFDNENRYLFYTGSSRARFRLHIVATCNDQSAEIIYKNLSKSTFAKNAKNKLANFLDATII